MALCGAILLLQRVRLPAEYEKKMIKKMQCIVWYKYLEETAFLQRKGIRILYRHIEEGSPKVGNVEDTPRNRASKSPGQ